MAVFNGGVLCCKGLVISSPSRPYCASSAALRHRFSTGKPRGLELHGRSCFKPCQASYFKEAFPFPEALQPADPSSNDLHPSTVEISVPFPCVQVFRDETKGIVCYQTSTGEITCEGIDEGPHFDPPSNYLRVQFPRQLVSAKARYDENYVNGAGI